MLGKCCVFQKFDKGGPYDKRYDEVILPAITNANLEAYRVDKDNSAPIPIDALHQQIQESIACLADISELNPNVMYELGAAIHGNKDVVIISSDSSEKFPFDIRHRSIIQYQMTTYSDFDHLKAQITDRLMAIQKTEANIEQIVTASVVKPTHGLRPQEIVALALVMTDRTGMSETRVKAMMERAGYNEFAAALALTTLKKAEFLTLNMIQTGDDEYYATWYLTDKGEDWLITNQDGLELKLPEPPKPYQRIVRKDDPF